MKKRKFENGGSTDEYVPRFRAIKSGDGALTTEDGMPVLSAGYDTEDERLTEKTLAKAAEKSRPRMYQPYETLVPGKESRLAKFIKSLIRQKPSARRVTDEELRGYKKGGSVTRGDGIAKRGKTKGRYI